MSIQIERNYAQRPEEYLAMVLLVDDQAMIGEAVRREVIANGLKIERARLDHVTLTMKVDSSIVLQAA